MARFRINTPSVVSDVIDGEVIGIDLDSGTYYSLRGSAADVWRLLGGGASVDEVLDALSAQYEGVDREAIVAFLAELQQERLIVESGDERPLEPAPAVAERSAFPPPRFERYTDMREFLLVDPIHEVDVTQWPERRSKG